MARRYTYETTLCVDGENDLDVKVSFTVTWGRPATGPTYDCGGTPADPDEVDDITVETINGNIHPIAAFGTIADKRLADLIVAKLYDERDALMIASAWKDRVADREAYDEGRLEAERERA